MRKDYEEKGTEKGNMGEDRGGVRWGEIRKGEDGEISIPWMLPTDTTLIIVCSCHTLIIEVEQQNCKGEDIKTLC